MAKATSASMANDTMCAGEPGGFAGMAPQKAAGRVLPRRRLRIYVQSSPQLKRYPTLRRVWIWLP